MRYHKMFLLSLFVLTTSICISQQSDASKWIYIGLATNGPNTSKWYIKNSVATRDRYSFQVWVKQVDNKDTYKGKAYKNVTKMKLYEIDCSENRYKLLSIASYTSSGTLIYSDRIKSHQADWESVIPETMGESMLMKACELFKD